MNRGSVMSAQESAVELPRQSGEWAIRVRMAALLLAVSVMLPVGALISGCGNEGAPLKLGVLLVNSETQTEAALDRLRAVKLAVAQVNNAGGVFGMPVEIVEGDTFDPENETRRLIEKEGVHAIVGPNSSAHALLVVEIAAPSDVLVVSSSASSPLLSEVDDRDLFFRTILSDVAQGSALAQLARDRGFDNVGVIYRDDAWGNGLVDAFRDEWTGGLAAVPSPASEVQETYMELIEKSAEDGAQALALLTYWTEAVPILRESMESGLYDQFIFGDALRRSGLSADVGVGSLAGMYGTVSGPLSDSASAVAWDAAFRAEYGKDTEGAYVKESYDAAIAIMLAAEAAGSAGGGAIRDELRGVGSAPGETIIASPEHIAQALDAIRDGREIDYEGAANSLDWDSNGDLRKGYIAIWRFTESDKVEDVKVLPYER